MPAVEVHYSVLELAQQQQKHGMQVRERRKSYNIEDTNKLDVF